MTRVLLALIGVAVALGAAIYASSWFGSTRTEGIAVRFMEAYSKAEDLGGLDGLATLSFMSGGKGDEYVRNMRVARRHMGRFRSIEKRLLERERFIGHVRVVDMQFLGKFDKGSALVKLVIVDHGSEWLVDAISIEIPPNLMRRSPEEFAEMIALESVRRLSRGEFPEMLQMATADFTLRFPEDVVAEALGPLLAERGELTGIGVVESQPAGVNRRDMRVVALYKDGIPLGFDLALTWSENRWRVDDMSMEEAPGATIPEGQLRGPVRERRAPRKKPGR